MLHLISKQRTRFTPDAALSREFTRDFIIGLVSTDEKLNSSSIVLRFSQIWPILMLNYEIRRSFLAFPISPTDFCDP